MAIVKPLVPFQPRGSSETFLLGKLVGSVAASRPKSLWLKSRILCLKAQMEFSGHVAGYHHQWQFNHTTSQCNFATVKLD